MLGYGAIGQFTIGQISDFIGPIVQPWTDPPQPKIKASLAIALIASGLFTPTPVLTPSQGWQQKLSEPIFQKSRQSALISSGPIGPVLDPNTQITHTLMSRWYQPLSLPVRIPPNIRAANQR